MPIHTARQSAVSLLVLVVWHEQIQNQIRKATP
nr:MAG TPA: hypothetical protein [Bacteriophage sp.]